MSNSAKEVSPSKISQHHDDAQNSPLAEEVASARHAGFSSSIELLSPSRQKVLLKSYREQNLRRRKNVEGFSNQISGCDSETTKGGEPLLPEVLITKKELARKLRVSERKIELDGNMPCIRWDRTVRYDWGEVVEYLRRRGDVTGV